MMSIKAFVDLVIFTIAIAALVLNICCQPISLVPQDTSQYKEGCDDGYNGSVDERKQST
jgi:hypothetical protein